MTMVENTIPPDDAPQDEISTAEEGPAAADGAEVADGAGVKDGATTEDRAKAAPDPASADDKGRTRPARRCIVLIGTNAARLEVLKRAAIDGLTAHHPFDTPVGDTDPACCLGFEQEQGRQDNDTVLQRRDPLTFAGWHPTWWPMSAIAQGVRRFSLTLHTTLGQFNFKESHSAVLPIFVVNSEPTHEEIQHFEKTARDLRTLPRRRIPHLAIAIDGALGLVQRPSPPIHPLHAWQLTLAHRPVDHAEQAIAPSRDDWADVEAQVDAAWDYRLSGLTQDMARRGVQAFTLPIDTAAWEPAAPFNLRPLLWRLTAPTRWDRSGLAVAIRLVQERFTG